MKGFWTCQRVTRSEKCGALNPNRKRICDRCGKKRSARRKPAHMVALNEDYATYMTWNGGNHCGICGAPPKPGGRRLHRDHDHRSGLKRGLLCFRCNAALRPYMTLEWLRNAVAYLERTS